MPHLRYPWLQVHQDILTIFAKLSQETFPGEGSYPTPPSPVVRQPPKRPALAEEPGPISDHGFGVYAAADPGGVCSSLL
jgi:hypothetical protein